MVRTKIIPRGLRNNNPLNIRIGNNWLGERPPRECSDDQFEEFVAMVYGLRAAFCIIRRYIRHYHRNTIRLIIRSWAPAHENDTLSYVQAWFPVKRALTPMLQSSLKINQRCAPSYGLWLM